MVIKTVWYSTGIDISGLNKELIETIEFGIEQMYYFTSVWKRQTK